MSRIQMGHPEGEKTPKRVFLPFSLREKGSGDEGW